MAKAPAYQWYPGDWRRDSALQACSFDARAIWREMIDTMHDGQPYGHLTAGGVAITAEQFARMIGVPPGRVRVAWGELEERQVFSRTDDGVIYSRRMVRDEQLRRKRAAGGSKGGNPALLKDKSKVNTEVNLQPNLPPTPAVAVASAVASAVKEKEKPPIGGPKKAAPQRGTQIPDDWRPTAEHRGLAAQLGGDVELEAVRFRDWAVAKGQVFRDWNAAFRNWLRKAKELNGHRPPAGSEASRITNEYPGRGRRSEGSNGFAAVSGIGEISPNGLMQWNGNRWVPL